MKLDESLSDTAFIDAVEDILEQTSVSTRRVKSVDTVTGNTVYLDGVPADTSAFYSGSERVDGEKVHSAKVTTGLSTQLPDVRTIDVTDSANGTI